MDLLSKLLKGREGDGRGMWGGVGVTVFYCQFNQTYRVLSPQSKMAVWKQNWKFWKHFLTPFWLLTKKIIDYVLLLVEYETKRLWQLPFKRSDLKIDMNRYRYIYIYAHKQTEQLKCRVEVCISNFSVARRKKFFIFGNSIILQNCQTF